MQSLEAAVVAATSLYQLPRGEFPIDYLDVLTAQNELFAAIRDLIETKGEQLAAVANAYQALGGGLKHRFLQKEFVGPPSPEVAAEARARAMPPPPNDRANPDPQPADPKTPQPRPANDLPPAIP